MIVVTRINKVERFFLNEDLIEMVEETPDTVVTMQSTHKYIVAESAKEICDMIIAQKRRVIAPCEGAQD